MKPVRPHSSSCVQPHNRVRVVKVVQNEKRRQIDFHCGKECGIGKAQRPPQETPLPQRTVLKWQDSYQRRLKYLLPDYPGVLERLQKDENAKRLPWHSLSEMTVWEFVQKHLHLPRHPKREAPLSVPHRYYQQSAATFKACATTTPNEESSDPAIATFERYFGSSGR